MGTGRSLQRRMVKSCGETSLAPYSSRTSWRLIAGRIISTVNTSGVVTAFLPTIRRAALRVTKVGPPAIAEAIRSHEDVIFATEESGKHIWPDIILYGDAALATGKLLGIMKRNQKSLEELKSELPKFHQFKSTIPCPERLKSEAFRTHPGNVEATRRRSNLNN